MQRVQKMVLQMAKCLVPLRVNSRDCCLALNLEIHWEIHWERTSDCCWVQRRAPMMGHWMG